MIIIDDCKTMKFKDPKVKEIFMRGRRYQVMYRPTNDITVEPIESSKKSLKTKVEEKKFD
jgi:hypothetical protein